MEKRALFAGRAQPAGTLSKSKTNAQVLICQVEATIVRNYRAIIRAGHIDGQPKLVNSWDPQQFLSEPNGMRFLEELVRRLETPPGRSHSSDQVDFLAITLPGTLEGHSIIGGSSRLGIRDSVNVTTECKKLGAPPTYVFHDAECRAVGEILSGAVPTNVASGKAAYDTFAYIIVDEGVGACLFIDGRPYRGAGVAGHLGRLVMEPSGTFNPAFTSRGTLEVFAARPWVSQNVVNEYLAEKGKTGAPSPASNPFRAAVEAAAEPGHERRLTFRQLAEGLGLRDPLVTAVLQEAALYLSMAINAVITIMNPPLIMLGGGMISDLPEFSSMVISYARRNAWAGSWNETTIHVAGSGHGPQIAGTAHLLMKVMAGEM